MKLCRSERRKVVAIMSTATLLSSESTLVNDASNGAQIRIVLDRIHKAQSGLQSFGIANNARITPGDFPDLLNGASAFVATDVDRRRRNRGYAFLTFHRCCSASTEYERFEQ